MADSAVAGASSPPEGFPVATQQFSADISGQPTEFLFSAYSDRLLLIITQVGTLGTIVRAEREEVLGGGSSGTYRLDTLVGCRDDPALDLCARQLAQLVAEAGCSKPLLLCLGLRRHAGGAQAAAQAVRELLEAAKVHPVW